MVVPRVCTGRRSVDANCTFFKGGSHELRRTPGENISPKISELERDTDITIRTEQYLERAQEQTFDPTKKHEHHGSKHHAARRKKHHAAPHPENRNYFRGLIRPPRNLKSPRPHPHPHSPPGTRQTPSPPCDASCFGTLDLLPPPAEQLANILVLRRGNTSKHHSDTARRKEHADAVSAGVNSFFHTWCRVHVLVPCPTARSLGSVLPAVGAVVRLCPRPDAVARRVVRGRRTTRRCRKGAATWNHSCSLQKRAGVVPRGGPFSPTKSLLLPPSRMLRNPFKAPTCHLPLHQSTWPPPRRVSKGSCRMQSRYAGSSCPRRIPAAVPLVGRRSRPSRGPSQPCRRRGPWGLGRERFSSKPPRARRREEETGLSTDVFRIEGGQESIGRGLSTDVFRIGGSAAEEGRKATTAAALPVGRQARQCFPPDDIDALAHAGSGTARAARLRDTNLST